LIRPRSIVKGLGWILAVLLAFAALWLVGNRWLDESPEPNRDAFLISASDQLPDERNIAVGILGLTAPHGHDVLKYGAKVKALYTANAPWTEVRDMLQGPNTVQPTADSQQITCWLDPDGLQMKGCLPFDQAPGVLKENGEILERYKQLHQLKAYSGLGTTYNQAYLTTAKLAVAEIHVDLKKGDTRSAYRKWQRQVSFAKDTLQGPDTWVGKAVGFVAIGMSLPALENILLADPRLARQHASELKTVLRSEGIKGFNPEGIMRAEYALLLDALKFGPQEAGDWPVDRLHWLAYRVGQRERILNRYYFFARDYAVVLGLPWLQFKKEAQRFRDAFAYPSAWDISIDPFGSMFLADYVEGQLKAGEMVRQMHLIDGRLRLSTLLVRIIDERIPDAAIARFLETAGADLFDPFTDKPMSWDPKERVIYFPDPDNQCARYAWLRVPSAVQSTASHQPDGRKC
jgi:hypothetical protein